MGIIDDAREAMTNALTPNFVNKVNTALAPQAGAEPPTPAPKDEAPTVAPRGTPAANREIWNRAPVQNVGEPIKTEPLP